MEKDPKKVAAAIAAVEQYRREEEEKRPAVAPVLPAFSLWALAGRQQIMTARFLLAGRLWK